MLRRLDLNAARSHIHTHHEPRLLDERRVNLGPVALQRAHAVRRDGHFAQLRLDLRIHARIRCREGSRTDRLEAQATVIDVCALSRRLRHIWQVLVNDKVVVVVVSLVRQRLGHLLVV